jgi:hypothetical protein
MTAEPLEAEDAKLVVRARSSATAAVIIIDGAGNVLQ